MEGLTRLLPLLLLLGCTAHPPSTACPPVPVWTPEQRSATADELDHAVAAGALDPEGPTVEALKDYQMFREQMELCQ